MQQFHKTQKSLILMILQEKAKNNLIQTDHKFLIIYT